MAIIYNSISDEIGRKSENNADIKAFLFDLFNLYKPNDKNKEGENLLTIFLNEATRAKSNIKIDSPLVNLFLEKKFKFQIDKVKPRHWDISIESLINTNQLQSLPKYLSDKSNFSYLLIPTVYTKKLMDCFYKQNILMYDENKKLNILDHIFDKDLYFTSHKQVLDYVDEMDEVLIKLFLNKNLKEEHLGILEKDQFINTFKCCIEKKIEYISTAKHINSILGKSVVFTQPPQNTIFNTEVHLKKLKATIFSELLKNDLPVNNQQKDKVKKTNKL